MTQGEFVILMKSNSRKTPRYRHWFLTINNHTEEDKVLIRRHARDYVFQEEKGESGTIHLQAVITFKNPRVFNGVKRLFKTAHIEVCRDLAQAAKYCSKPETRVSEPEISEGMMEVLGAQMHSKKSKISFQEWMKKLHNCTDMELKFTEEEWNALIPINEVMIGEFESKWSEEESEVDEPLPEL